MPSKMTFRTACVLGLISGVVLGGCVVVVDRTSDEWSSEFRSSGRPKIGVTLAEPGRTLANQLKIDRGDATVITDVSANSPADRAGLKRYDIVTAIDGMPKADIDDLRRAVRSKEWGESINFTIIREGQTIEVPILLERPDGRTGSYPS